MSLDLVLSEPHDFTRRQRQAVEAETARIDAVVAPAFIALRQVEELARRRAVTVELHLQRRLLGAGERARASWHVRWRRSSMRLASRWLMSAT
jgi:hypothetical protein